MKQKKINLVIGAVLFSIFSNAYAISDGIRNNRNDECAIYLCMPGGFVQGCSAAKSAYIGRITDLTHKGGRKYTDLPNFKYCIDQEPPNTLSSASQQSNVTYTTMYEIHMPSYNKATRWEWSYRKVTNSSLKGCDKSMNGECYVKDYLYCAAVQTTPARTFESSSYDYKYKTINIGDKDYTPEKNAPYRTFTDVLVDGKRVGERYYR